jgi:hypothetical protein
MGLAVSSSVLTGRAAVATEVLDHVHFIPAVAHVNGAGGTTWRSDVVLHNPGSGDATVELVFLESGEDNSNAAAHRMTVPPGTSIHLADIVAEPFGESAPTGAVLVRSNEPLLVTSKTYNDSLDGTFGQLIPGFPVSQALRTGAEARLIQLFRSPPAAGGFRTNVGFAEAAGVSTQLEVTLCTESGQVLGTVHVTLLPYEHTQINDIFGEVTEGFVDNGYAVITARTPNAAFFAYASVVDNLSGDPVYLPATVTPARIIEAGVWTPTVLRDVSVYALATDPFDNSRVMVGTKGHGLHVSDDWGAGWSRLSSGLEEDEVLAAGFSSTEPATIFAGTWHQETGNWRGGIYRSVDGGATWTKRHTTHVRAIAVHPDDGNTILVGTQGSGVFRSIDGGESWSTSNGGLGNPYVKSVAFAASSPDLVFAATEDGIDMSRDGGVSWTHSGLSYFFESVAVHPRDSTIVYTSRAVMNGGTLYQSLDGGLSWSEVDAAPPRVQCVVFDPSPPHTLYVGTAGNGVFTREADGEWVALNDGLTDLRVNALAVSAGDPRLLYAGTAGDWTAIGDGAVFVMKLP